MKKENKLEEAELKLLDEIIKVGEIKTRLDKITDLFNYTKQLKVIPRLNSDNEDERKFAMFYNNIKQCRKLNKLDLIELDALKQVELLVEQKELKPEPEAQMA
jgi:hypothetical protein